MIMYYVPLILKRGFEMKVGMAIGTCLMCGAVLLGGPHSAHECKDGWCSQPVTEMPDAPHSERGPSMIAAPEQMVMPPSRGWVSNNQTADLRRRIGDPAFHTNWSGNVAWMESATKRR